MPRMPRQPSFACGLLSENGALEMTKLVYPDGTVDEFGDVVDLLKSNGVVEHYDLMRRYDDQREGK